MRVEDIRSFRLYHRAIEVLGQDIAQVWLHDPNPALGNDTPADHAGTPDGLTEVLDLLGRIENGIW